MIQYSGGVVEKMAGQREADGGVKKSLNSVYWKPHDDCRSAEIIIILFSIDVDAKVGDIGDFSFFVAARQLELETQKRSADKRRQGRRSFLVFCFWST